MDALSKSTVLSPSVLVLAVLSAGVLWVSLGSIKIPILSNPRVAVIVLMVLGMAMCAQGGIGRVSAANAWTHPLSILAYLLGGLILLVALAVFTGWKLPLIAGESSALVAVAALMGLKVLVSLAHTFLAHI